MSDHDRLTSRLLMDRAQVSFGFAGKLVSLQSDNANGLLARCLCPYCGAEGCNYLLAACPGMIASINCPECNRAYRVPVVVRLKTSPEAMASVASAQELEAAGAPVQELELAGHKILSLDPANAYAWNLLLRLADFCKNPLTSARVLEHAIERDPYNPSLFEQMAVRLTLLGIDAAKGKYLRKAEHLRSIDVSATTYLDVVVSPENHKSMLSKQLKVLNLSVPVASFLLQASQQPLQAAS